MKKLLLALILLLPSTAFAGFSVPGCAPGTFAFIAQKQYGSEQGPTKVEGNILVTKDDGLAKIGAHNTVKGTLIADKIELGTGAVVDNCIADTITGPGTCTNVLGTVSAAPIECKVFTFVPPANDICVNTALAGTVPAGQTETLAPGCYKYVRVGLGGTLLLEDGVYVMGELRTLAGGTVQGTTVGRSRVIARTVTISPLSRLPHLDILTSSLIGDSVVLGNSVTFEDTQLIAAGSGIHLHTGFVANNSGVAAVRVVVEPGQFKDVPENPVCKCTDGFHLPPFTPAQQCFPD